MQPFMIFLPGNKIQQGPVGQGAPLPCLLPLTATPDQLVISGGPAAPHGNAGGRQM